jgi:uncharacterized protein
MSVRALVTLTLAVIAGPALAAPSFDCTKATKPVEKAICADPELSALDADIAAAFKAALARVSIDAGAVARLREYQRGFVAERNGAFAKAGYQMNVHLGSQKAMLEAWPQNIHLLAAADVAEWLKGLPNEVMEATSDGIADQAEMTALTTTGDSRDFTLTRIDARRAVAKNKHNTDRVEFTVVNLPEPLLLVHTRNMANSTFSFWMPGATPGRLDRHRPSIAVEAAISELYAFDDGRPANPDPLGRLAPALAKHLPVREACQHWAGEVSDGLPPERQKQIADAMARLKCETLPADEAKLRKSFARDEAIVRVLDKIKQMLGD